MKRFIKTYTVSRFAMIVVKHDADASTFRVLQWNADDEGPTELEQFRYKPKEHARTGDVRLHQAQDDAIRFAARTFERERSKRQGQIRAAV